MNLSSTTRYLSRPTRRQRDTETKRHGDKDASQHYVYLKIYLHIDDHESKLQFFDFFI